VIFKEGKSAELVREYEAYLATHKRLADRGEALKA
jgi:hypothetical protein